MGSDLCSDARSCYRNLVFDEVHYVVGPDLGCS